MVLKKFTSILGRDKDKSDTTEAGSNDPNSLVAQTVREMKAFCESGSSTEAGDEVLHLPTIVEACVASPQAAAASANQIRKYLSKDYSAQPSTQYNAIMLIRILADNPGQSFTKNMDKPFVQTVKEMLRTGKDPSVQQLLRETLYSLDSQKAYDTNMALLFTMWRRESSMMSPRSYGPRTLNAPSWDPNQAPLPPSQHPSESYSRNNSHRRERGLPPATELAARIEEARTSAKILDQRVDIVDKSEIMGDELVKEFADRCQAAQRSIQGYINADNPPADDDTLQTLIETNDKLSHSQSKYQHKILQGRRHLGVSSVTPSPPVRTPQGQYGRSAAAPTSMNYFTSQPPVEQPQPQSYVTPQSYTTLQNNAPQSYNSHQSYNESQGYTGSQNYSAYTPPHAREETYYPPSVPPSSVQQSNRHYQYSDHDLSATSGPQPDDPFSDAHAHPHHLTSGPPPPPPRNGLNSATSPISPTDFSGGSEVGGPTASYLQRRDDSGQNGTMHGTVGYGQDHGPGHGRRESGNVSPIEDRVTYRY